MSVTLLPAGKGEEDSLRCKRNERSFKTPDWAAAMLTIITIIIAEREMEWLIAG